MVPVRIHLLEVDLDPNWRMMDVFSLQARGSQILEPVWMPAETLMRCSVEDVAVRVIEPTILNPFASRTPSLYDTPSIS